MKIIRKLPRNKTVWNEVIGYKGKDEGATGEDILALFYPEGS